MRNDPPPKDEDIGNNAVEVDGTHMHKLNPHLHIEIKSDRTVFRDKAFLTVLDAKGVFSMPMVDAFKQHDAIAKKHSESKT